MSFRLDPLYPNERRVAALVGDEAISEALRNLSPAISDKLKRNTELAAHARPLALLVIAGTAPEKYAQRHHVLQRGDPTVYGVARENIRVVDQEAIWPRRPALRGSARSGAAVARH